MPDTSRSDAAANRARARLDELPIHDVYVQTSRTSLTIVESSLPRVEARRAARRHVSTIVADALAPNGRDDVPVVTVTPQTSNEWEVRVTWPSYTDTDTWEDVPSHDDVVTVSVVSS